MPTTWINGIHMHYDTYGTGVPIVFIHPPLLTSRNFIFQQADLADTFQVITFDIRGHGRTESSIEPITYPLIAGDLISLMDHLDLERCYVCGYSTGGSIALEAMLTYPRRFYGGILISVMPGVIDFQLKSYIKTAMLLSNERTKKWLMRGISHSNANTKQTFHRLYNEAVNGDINNIYQYYKESYSYSCIDRLAHLHLPQLLVYGDKDTLFLRYALLMSEHLLNNDVHLIKGAKHQIPTKNHADLHRVIRRWINKQYLP